MLLDSFRASHGISIVEHILQADENRREKKDANIVLLDNEFEQLKAEFVSKLDELAETNPEELITHEHLVSFLYRWKRWGNEDRVISWLKSQISDEEGCINLLKAFVSKSSSQAVGDYVVEINKYIKLESIENFIEVEPIRERIKNVKEDNLDFKAKEAVGAFKEALERREKGLTDDW